LQVSSRELETLHPDRGSGWPRLRGSALRELGTLWDTGDTRRLWGLTVYSVASLYVSIAIRAGMLLIVFPSSAVVANGALW